MIIRPVYKGYEEEPTYIIIFFRKYSRSPDISARLWHVELSSLNERTLKVPSKETDERTEREYRETRALWKLAA